MSTPKLITIDRVRHVFSYDGATGILSWRISTTNRVRAGEAVGSLNRYGYLATTIDGNRQMVHRLIWAFVYGKWPDEFLDHINGDRSDNRLCNLREASALQNAWNCRRHADSVTGVKGINFHKGRKKPFQARIYRSGTVKSLGYFSTIDEADAAYRAADRLLSGEFARAA
ncbi:HNH endonuclease signature motif containing protein [Methylopila sp. 73B]|uniref:HNH endonuclease signature motif containing protein n=1 Tax=Methylopila sp. 73B TaxID=1120792 RepID=UPI0003754139|nr:HNH endonuclease signature motif containing protein [Methylopila sp. 73B]